jgi:diaminopimelate epimerase
MKFTKMHGLGNDFIVVNGFIEDVRIIFDKAAKICDRHRGIGADGILLVLPSEKADLKMRIINSDGSEADMCGNGIRCFARYAFSRGLVKKTNMTVETLAGIIKPQVIVKDDQVESVRVDMGYYSLKPKDVPLIEDAKEEAVDLDIEVDGQGFKFTGVSMGNPHCVIFVDDVESFPVEQLGPKIEKHPFFPKKTNVEFVQVKGRDFLKMRVWERGAGLTMACGTGACASAVAAYKKGLTGPKVTVNLPGGDLYIEVEESGRVYMTGPAAEVYTGEIDLNML